MEHQPSECRTDNIGQEVPVIPNSVGGKVMLNEFYGNCVYYCNEEGNDSDFIQQKRKAPLFDESQHDKVNQDRKNKGVSQFICRNAEQELRLEPAVTRSA